MAKMRSGDRPAGSPRRRADAERSVERIVDAALDSLASNPDAGMADIARRAEVARATVYVHFPTREALIAELTHRGVSEVAQAIEAADAKRGDPTEALKRVVSQAWRTLGRYHALVAINAELPEAELHDRHHLALSMLEPLIKRGQRAGVFRRDVPAAWHLSMLLALVHAASAELRADRMALEEVEPALIATVVGALAGR